MVTFLKDFNILCVALVLTACGGGGDDGNSNPPQTVTPPGVFSMSAYFYTDPPIVDANDAITRFVAARDLALSAGANGQVSTYEWNDLEPTVGNYDMQRVSDFVNTMQAAADIGFVEFVGLQVINTVAREVPQELATTDWDDPAMMSAFSDFLDVLIDSMRGRVSYVSIGNEVDVYFSQSRTDELAGYKTFVDSARQKLRNEMPNVQVGTTITYNGWTGTLQQDFLMLVENHDVFFTTYYPLAGNFTVLTPDSPAADFANMVSIAGDRSVIYQEVGYPSSTTNNSSEVLQAEFFRNVFDAWQASHEKIEFLNLFLLHDLESALVDQLVSYYQVPGDEFRTYLATLGLRNADNTDKQSWPVVKEYAANAGFTPINE